MQAYLIDVGKGCGVPRMGAVTKGGERGYVRRVGRLRSPLAAAGWFFDV